MQSVQTVAVGVVQAVTAAHCPAQTGCPGRAGKRHKEEQIWLLPNPQPRQETRNL